MPDVADSCPHEFGLAKYDGCPDTDGDGLPDNKDKCPYKPGKPANLGCPDSIPVAAYINAGGKDLKRWDTLTWKDVKRMPDSAKEIKTATVPLIVSEPIVVPALEPANNVLAPAQKTASSSEIFEFTAENIKKASNKFLDSLINEIKTNPEVAKLYSKKSAPKQENDNRSKKGKSSKKKNDELPFDFTSTQIKNASNQYLDSVIQMVKNSSVSFANVEEKTKGNAQSATKTRKPSREKMNHADSLDEQDGPEIERHQVHFRFNKATLSKGTYVYLDSVVAVMTDDTGTYVTIDGYCDNVGPVLANRRMSKARSVAVKHYISKKGIASARIKTHGNGSEGPIADNKTPKGRAMNRRALAIVRKKVRDNKIVNTSDIKVFANDTKGSFTIILATNFEENASCLISNSLGRLITKFDFPANKPYVFNLNAPSGLYLFTAETATTRYEARIVITQ